MVIMQSASNSCSLKCDHHGDAREKVTTNRINKNRPTLARRGMQLAQRDTWRIHLKVKYKTATKSPTSQAKTNAHINHSIVGGKSASEHTLLLKHTSNCKPRQC